MFLYDVNYSHLLSAYSNKAALTARMQGLRQYCHFPASQKTEVTYVCFQNEVCCLNGCCVSSFKKMMQFWYFWLLFVIICVAFTGCMHYCTKFRESRLEQRFQRQRRGFSQRLFRTNRMLYTRPSDIDPHCPVERRLQAELGNEDPVVNQDPRRNIFVQRLGGQRVVESFDREIILEELWESYRNNQNNTQISKPPDYNEIEKELYLEPPPRYADACKLQESNQAKGSAEGTSLPSFQEAQSSNFIQTSSLQHSANADLPTQSSNLPQSSDLPAEISDVRLSSDLPVNQSSDVPVQSTNQQL